MFHVMDTSLTELQRLSVRTWSPLPSEYIDSRRTALFCVPTLEHNCWASTSTKETSLTSIAQHRHAGRSTVNVSDVMLLARRNEGLDSILRAFVEQQRPEGS
jgi:hypothetical protein